MADQIDRRVRPFSWFRSCRDSSGVRQEVIASRDMIGVALATTVLSCPVFSSRILFCSVLFIDCKLKYFICHYKLLQLECNSE